MRGRPAEGKSASGQHPFRPAGPSCWRSLLPLGPGLCPEPRTRVSLRAGSAVEVG